MTNNEDILISTGKWSHEIRWAFYLSSNIPSENLVTAVCCIVIYKQQIVLVKNKRGWELPGGKIKANENPLEGIVREVKEETGFSLIDPKNVGYKKIISSSPINNPEKPGACYPFPYSYVTFFLSDGILIENKKPSDEILEIKLVTFNDAISLLEKGRQYEGILNSVLKKNI